MELSVDFCAIMKVLPDIAVSIDSDVIDFGPADDE
jgi:hypothetical protein